MQKNDPRTDVNNRCTRVEIVTPVHNRKSITLQCLRSLSNIDRNGLEVHIIVVDDGSSDGTSEAIREHFPEVEVIPGDGTLFYTAGTNRGIQAALHRDPAYILAINDDSIFHDQFLQRLVHCAESNPRSVIGPLLLLWDQPHRIFQVGARWDTYYGGWRHPRKLTIWSVPATPWEVEVIVGNCVLFPVHVIKHVGLMREKAFPHGFGDAEYTARMRRAGWKLLIEPQAFVWCQPNAIPPSLRTLSKRKLLQALFIDQRNQQNLIRQFAACWLSAPSPWIGTVAFGIMLIRLGFKFLGLGTWPDWPDPPPDLAEPLHRLRSPSSVERIGEHSDQ